ncbi:MAG: hypothetical protein MK106_01260 [Mariniblastus sp.]|nr:hypothetical protein [Mariniblastus sp.]
MQVNRFLLALLFAWLTAMDSGPLPAQKSNIADDLPVIQGLRQRRLFDLADQLCRQYLSNPELDATQRVQLQLELIRTLLAEAIATPLAERAAVWRRVDLAITDFRNAYPDHPRKLLIEVQQALAHQTRGNLLVQEIAAEIGGPAEKDKALVELRNASRQIKQVESEIDRLIPAQRGRRLGEHELSVDQLLNLRRNLRFQEAQTNLIKAQLYAPDDRLNRLDTLSLVSGRLDEVLRQSNPDQSLWWQAQIKRMKCYTLLGDNAAAEAVFRELPLKQLPAAQAVSLLEQRTDAAVASGKTENVTELLNAVQQNRSSSPTLQLSVLRLYIHLAKQASDPAVRSQWQGVASQLTQTIETTNGPYWGRRAELILIGPTVRSNPNDVTGAAADMGTDFNLLIRVGDQAVRKANMTDAIRAFKNAAVVAQKKGNAEQSLLANVRLSQVHESRKDHQLAAEVLIAAALENTRFPLASAAHLRGCWNWAQFSQQDKSQAPKFVELLAQNLQTWPQAKTADQARLWVASYYQSQSDWSQAIAAYLQVDMEGVRTFEACRQIAQCYTEFLKIHRPNEPETRELAQQIMNRFPDLVKPPRAAVLLIAQVGLTSNTLPVEQITAMLKQFIQSATDNEWEAKQRAQAWQIVGLALKPNTVADAKTSIADLPNELSLLQLCVTGLRQAQEFTPPEQTASIAGLKILVAAKALAASSQGSSQTYWLLEKARALQQLGEDTTAIEILRKLTVEKPKSQEIQLRLGRSLSKVGPGSEEALQQWRRIATQVRPQSTAWFEAKLNVAKTLAAAGQDQKALEMLQYMNAIPPGWSQSLLKAEFDKLLIQLKKEAAG